MKKLNDTLSTLKDEELMSIFIKNKDRQVFTLIYNRYYQSLYKFMVWCSGNTEIARDLSQNVFLKVYSKPELYEASKNFKIWLFSVAKNHWKNELRRKTIARKYFKESNDLIKFTDDPELTFSDIQVDKVRAIHNAMEKLSDIHKDVIVLKYSNNLTIQEISQVLKCNEGTVKSRLFHAIKKLKETINK